MAGSGAFVSVESIPSAQELVPFPVFVPGDPALTITTRPATRSRWASLRTTHQVESVRFSMKQYAMDYFGHFSAPNKLYTTKPDHWTTYAPITELGVGDGSAFHGREWDGVEGGSLVRLATHIEVRVQKGYLGPRKIERILGELSPLDRRDAVARASRPLSLWNWSVSGRRIPGSSQTAETSGLGWIPGESTYVRGSTGAPARTTVQGWSLDSVAFRPQDTRSTVRTLWRSTDLNSVLEVTFIRDTHHAQSQLAPLPPLFDCPLTITDRIRGIRSSVLRWAHYEVCHSTGTFRVVIPPGRSELTRDRHLLRELTVEWPRVKSLLLRKHPGASTVTQLHPRSPRLRPR
jgi:hypothetical protein